MVFHSNHNLNGFWLQIKTHHFISTPSVQNNVVNNKSSTKTLNLELDLMKLWEKFRIQKWKNLKFVQTPGQEQIRKKIKIVLLNSTRNLVNHIFRRKPLFSRFQFGKKTKWILNFYSCQFQNLKVAIWITYKNANSVERYLIFNNFSTVFNELISWPF